MTLIPHSKTAPICDYFTKPVRFPISLQMGGKARRPKADYIRLVRAANHILPDSPDTPDSPDNLDSAQLSEIVPGTNDSNSPFKNRTDL